MLWRRFFSCGLLLALAPACRKGAAPRDLHGVSGQAAAPIALPSVLDRVAAPAIPSAVTAFERQLRETKLSLPPRVEHEPRLVFARDVVAQLTRDSLRLRSVKDFGELLREPLEKPRAVLALVDGSVLAFGSHQLLYWQPGWKRCKSLARPSLLPFVHVYADAQRADHYWVFDGDGGRDRGAPVLLSYRLNLEADGEGEGVPLPEETFELVSPRGGVLGVSREGVWLYATPGQLERRAPGGLRLTGASLPEQPLPTWLAPAPRLDQAFWVKATGEARRVLLVPDFKPLGGTIALPGKPIALEVGDSGNLLASVLVAPGALHFDLDLRDAELRPLAQVPLPGDDPTLDEDWVAAVTENQRLAVTPGGRYIAVGGPDRLAIFDAAGQQLFFNSSR